MTKGAHTPEIIETREVSPGLVRAFKKLASTFPEIARYKTDIITIIEQESNYSNLLEATTNLIDFLESYPHQYQVDISGVQGDAEAAIQKARGRLKDLKPKRNLTND
jgi:hypothetical protein